ncbi:hypothetical protein PE066_03925 [Ramlibacter tataouinensis]|uniref:hypothetical protein n=1 Tax=Ramlibacter tataouinensis TaxID=94132 RepID=UPI0022F3B877|nr:hypothetical protein [Ramlibacter tataouinensis]WBY02698.1 hypothetical protein PE066_03925 [Ramlibacter tataouinensis]
MSKAEKRSARRMHDDHSREEAGLRRAQQHEAGDTHHPVQDMPSHGEQPVGPHSADRLRRNYEDALRREAQAWSRVQGLPGDAGFAEEAWEDWRDAVEERERATRLMINSAMDVGSRD